VPTICKPQLHHRRNSRAADHSRGDFQITQGTREVLERREVFPGLGLSRAYWRAQNRGTRIGVPLKEKVGLFGFYRLWKGWIREEKPPLFFSTTAEDRTAGNHREARSWPSIQFIWKR